MSKTTGHVNEEGSFSLVATFDPQNPNDIEQMMKLLHNQEMNATVKDYGPDFVEVSYRPEDLGSFGI